MRYPVVLLDVGETLIGPRDSFGAVYARVFGELGLERPVEAFEGAVRAVWDGMQRSVPPGTDRYRHYPGGEEEYWLRFVNDTLERVTGAPPRDGLARRGLKRLREIFRGPAEWQVYPDVVPALDALRAAGARLAVVSNWDSRLPTILETLQLADYFEVVGVSHFEGVEKPNPLFFRRVLERLGAGPDDALHVGDLPEIDLDGARAAGVACVLVDRRNRLDPAFDPLPNLSELPRIAREGCR